MINILLKQSKEIQLNNSLCVKFVSTTNIAKKILGGGSLVTYGLIRKSVMYLFRLVI